MTNNTYERKPFWIHPLKVSRNLSERARSKRRKLKIFVPIGTFENAYKGISDVQSAAITKVFSPLMICTGRHFCWRAYSRNKVTGRLSKEIIWVVLLPSNGHNNNTEHREKRLLRKVWIDWLWEVLLWKWECSTRDRLQPKCFLYRKKPSNSNENVAKVM